MIQFNLLPNVKLEYVKARRTQHLVIVVAVILAVAALVIFFLLLLYVDVAQKKHLNDLGRDISTNSQTLAGDTNLNKVLTIQNQLESLPSLDDQKPAASRLFTYMTQVTPSAASISDLSTDFTKHTLTITGDADSLSTVNQYVDTLKFTTFSDSNAKNTKAFSDVVLSSFSPSGTNAAVSYTINLSFDPSIFDATQNVTLTVPQITTTRSVTQQPTDLFRNGGS